MVFFNTTFKNTLLPSTPLVAYGKAKTSYACIFLFCFNISLHFAFEEIVYSMAFTNQQCLKRHILFGAGRRHELDPLVREVELPEVLLLQNVAEDGHPRPLALLQAYAFHIWRHVDHVALRRRLK
jgi:hypothetical protein